MKIWGIGDLHLSFGVKNKKMNIFGWIDHENRIKSNWENLIKEEDWILLPGDFSWAMKIEEVEADMLWLDKLPGNKILIKGNHDYWWSSTSKVKKILPSSLRIIYNSAINLDGLSIGGTKMVDLAEELETTNLKLYNREMGRLKQSLLEMTEKEKIILLHHPPFGKKNEIISLFNKEQINYCCYGHIHNVKENMDRTIGETKYLCLSSDYLNFCPKLITEL